jgi:hypothetical protein
MGWRCRQVQHRRRGRRIPAFVHASQANGTLKILWFMQLDVHLNVVRKATREQLRLLQRHEPARARHAHLEGVQICVDRRCEWKAREVRQMISTERQPKTLMAEASELLPLWPATVAF